jgi:uncharacterized coiled-coil DUF342 family protein
MSNPVQPVQPIQPQAINKDEVIKKQADFIDSFQKLLGMESSQTINTIVNPLVNRIGNLENKLNVVVQQANDLRKELDASKKCVADLQAVVNDNKSSFEVKQHKVEEILRAIGNICTAPVK